MELVNLSDYEALARERLPALAYDYYAGGADNEITLRENRAAFASIKLHYHVLRDVGLLDCSTTVLGERISMPILVAPTAFQAMADAAGEVATAKAAGSIGTIMALSTLSNFALEDVAAAGTGPLWFQLYVYRDRGATTELIRRVEAAGFSALMLTVDAPVLGRRERDMRNHFQLPQGLQAGSVVPPGLGDLPEAAGSALTVYFASLLDSSLTWKDLDWLRATTRLPLLLKGVVRADDAAEAVRCGMEAIVVSNHGGRQLDAAPATIDVLPRIVEAVDGRAEVLIDGGIRRGTDVVKALAFGARAVMVGRPILWGLAVDGEAGVTKVLEMLRAELGTAMALCGCASIAEIGRDLLL